MIAVANRAKHLVTFGHAPVGRVAAMFPEVSRTGGGMLRPCPYFDWSCSETSRAMITAG